MIITKATPAHAADIAQLIMTAMTDDCCQFLAGKDHTLDDEATNGDIDHAPVAGVIVGYDGKDLRRLRRRFQEEALSCLGMDYSNMDDETQEGEFYLDSLAVYSEYRKRGIASKLLQRFVDYAAELGLPAALLVDKNNPNAERLYTSLGFVYKNDAMWGGHEMRHLVHELPQ